MMNALPLWLYRLIAVLAGAAVTILLRAFPFIAFSRGGKPVPVITYIGQKLAPAAIAMLAVYCLAAEAVGRWDWRMWPELTASAAVILMQYFFRKPLLSILLGTILYMVLIQHC